MIKHWVNTVKNLFSRTVRLDGKGDPYFWKVNWLGRDGEATVDAAMHQGYGQNPYIFSVVDKVAESVAHLPRHFVDANGNEVNPIPEYLKLIENPNYKEGFHEFYYRLAANYLISGECFVHAWRAIGFRSMSELVAPNVLNVDIQADTYGKVTSYSYNYFGQHYTNILPADMLHIFRPDITEDEQHGFSALVAGSRVYEADNELRAAKAYTFRNRGASGMVYSKGGRPMTEKERQEMQVQLDMQTLGDKQGKLHFASTELGYVAIGMDGNVIKAIENEGLHNLRDACRLIGIDSKLFGDPAASTYNNMAEAKMAAYTDVYLPLANKIDRALSQWILESMGKKGIYYVPNPEKIPILKDYKRNEAEVLAIDIASGIITADEARAIRYPNLPPRNQQSQ